MINRVVLVGRLTKDVEVRKTQSGLSVASFTVACDRNRRSQDNSQQTADFINCVAWRQSADFLGQYAHKGALIGVDGRVQTRSYDRNDGTKVYVTEVVCDSVQLLESKSQSQARAQNSGYDNGFSQSNYNNQNNGGYNSYNEPSYSQPQNQNNGQNDNYNNGAPLDISSDDLPF